jgi:hypothetical protein
MGAHKLIEDDEKAVPKSFDLKEKDTGNILRYLNDFEIQHKTKGTHLSLDDFDKLANSMMVRGSLIEPSNKEKQFEIVLKNIDQWAFDYTKENKGIWICTQKNIWYKLMNPNGNYAKVYNPFFEYVSQTV